MLLLSNPDRTTWRILVYRVSFLFLMFTLVFDFGSYCLQHCGSTSLLRLARRIRKTELDISRLTDDLASDRLLTPALRASQSQLAESARHSA